MHKICVLDRIDITEEQKSRLIQLGGSNSAVGFFNSLPNPSDANEILRRIGDAPIVLTSWTDFPAQVIEQLPSTVKMLSIVATSYAWVDVAASRKRGIAVSNVPGYARYSVSELVFAFILDWARKVRQADAEMRIGKYDRAPFMGKELFGKTMGIIGLGSIGSRVAIIAKAYGMNVNATTLHPDDNRAKTLGVKLTDLNSTFSSSDIITIHVPLNDKTRGLIGRKQFEVIKKGAFFIYTSRPGVCDEEALLWALEAGQLAGAGLDETSEAIRTPGSRLLKMSNVCLSPEIGFYTAEALKRLTDISIDNVESFMQGKAVNIAN